MFLYFMDRNVLKYFYNYNGKKNEFLKIQFIRLIRNKIIDPNTKIFLSHGVDFFDEDQGCTIKIPCDDANWNEYQTFNEGFKLNVLAFPFTIKLYHDYFYNLEDYDHFLKLYSEIIKFRTETIKVGWAIKYGLPYKDHEYTPLEDLKEDELLNWRDPRKDAKLDLEMLTEDDFDIR